MKILQVVLVTQLPTMENASVCLSNRIGRKTREVSLDMEFVAKTKHGANTRRLHRDLGQHGPTQNQIMIKRILQE